MILPKKSSWNMIFFVLSGKMIFLFPENMIVPLRRKMKDDLSQNKKHKNMIFSSFLNFVQKGPRWYMIFVVLPGKMVFFSRNMIFFLWAESERWPFSRNTEKYDISCVHNVRVLQTWRHAPLSKKNQRWSYHAKIHLKVIDVLDWHSRKSSSNSLCFHGDLYRRFHVLHSREKKPQET